jgi:hypothetical protein
MPLLTSPLQNLIGGVSQQPAAIRAANEAEAIDNAVPSPVEGLTKRPPTEMVTAVTSNGSTLRHINTNQSVFIHLIERDETEKYLLCVTEAGDMDIFDLAGNRKTLYQDVVSGSPVTLGAATKSQRKALTIGDVTFLSNATKIPAMTNAVVTPNPTTYNRAGLVWIRQTNYNREHIIKLTNGSVTSTFTNISRSVVISNAGSTGTNNVYSNVPLIYVSGTYAQTNPIATITVSGGKVTKVQITSDGAGWDSEQITASKWRAAPATIGNVNNFEVTIDSTTTGEIGTDHVARSLFEGSTSSYIGPVGGIVATSPYVATTYEDSVIYLKSTTADFTVVVEDDFAGEGMVYIRDEVQRFEDLPPTAPHGYMVKVVGAPESEYDDYWVKFKADNGTFSRGIWEECAAPGVKTTLNSSEMPLILIRQSDLSFMLKRADGTTPASNVPGGANYNAYKWTDRLVGDDLTNPLPSFVGIPIQDMVFHQNRLGFLSGENIVFSETSEFFNFFRTTTLDILDSNPIDVASSSPRVGKIVAAIPFNRDLILFTPTSQMVLRGGEILSPRQVAIIPVAEFDSQASTVKPIPSANAIFFTFANGGFTGLREMVPQPALDGSYLANDLTTSVSRYIPGNPTHLTATTHDNLAAVVSNGELYCYRYFNSGNERIQSAWFRFTFQDSNAQTYAHAKAVWAGFVESDLYVVLKRTRDVSTSYLTIEKIRMGVGINDVATTGKSWVTCLDQRKYYPAGQGTYSSATGLTTFTLAKPMSYVAGKTQVVTANGLILNNGGGTAFNISTQAAGTVSVIGDYSSTPVWIGTAYTTLYEFSTPYLKGAAGRGTAALLNGRYQLRYLSLQYADSGYFRVTVQIKNEDTYEYPFTGEILGSSTMDTPNIQSGSFRVPIYSRNDNVTIKVLNDSPFPSKILNGEFEGTYDDRAIRYGS